MLIAYNIILYMYSLIPTEYRTLLYTGTKTELGLNLNFVMLLYSIYVKYIYSRSQNYRLKVK